MKKKNWRLFILVLRDCKTSLVFLVPTLPPCPNRVFLSVQEEEGTRTKAREVLMTCFVKSQVKGNFGWTGREKRRGDLPCQRMELIHSEDASKLYCHNSKLFLLWSTSGFQWCDSRVLVVFCSTRYLKMSTKTSRTQRTRIGNHSKIQLLVSHDPPPPLHLQLCYLLYLLRTSTLASKISQF